MRWCEYLVKRRATAWAENSPGRVTLTPFNRSRRPFYSVTGFNSHYTLSSYVHFAFLPSAVFTMYSQFILVWSSRMSFTKCILERWTSRSNLLNQDLDPMGVVHVVLVWILTLDPIARWRWGGPFTTVFTAFRTSVQAMFARVDLDSVWFMHDLPAVSFCNVSNWLWKAMLSGDPRAAMSHFHESLFLTPCGLVFIWLVSHKTKWLTYMRS